MSPTSHSVNSVSEREIEQYDHEVDVVIVGYGCAGGAAVFTLGGLSTDLDAGVADLDGVANPGLFAPAAPPRACMASAGPHWVTAPSSAVAQAGQRPRRTAPNRSTANRSVLNRSALNREAFAGRNIFHKRRINNEMRTLLDEYGSGSRIVD